ncbi:MAG TPA: PC4/YdbC family ssDNA-binding protein [Anaerovoracaceae bacterium]|nr:PC4/YdbC family ssDNA-binding protein [Anaerovoracaceae bacterium]
MAEARDREVTFELVEHIGIFGKDPKGWTKELNRVAWNGGVTKYDIRSWDENHLKMGRGVTLTKQELIDLRSLFGQIE